MAHALAATVAVVVFLAFFALALCRAGARYDRSLPDDDGAGE